MASSDNIAPRHSHFRLFTVILTVLGSLGAAGVAVGTAAIVVNKYKEKVDLLENALSRVSIRIEGLEKTGAPGSGDDSAPGSDGRDIQLHASATHIEWRYAGDQEWEELVALENLRGRQGPRGNDGAAASLSAADLDRVDNLISQQVSEKIAEISKSPASSASTLVTSTPDAFDTSRCISAESLRGKATFVLQKGMEFCAADGRVLHQVVDINKHGQVFFSNPGRQDGVCAFEEKCFFSSIDATYIFERQATDEKGIKALFRLSED